MKNRSQNKKNKNHSCVTYQIPRVDWEGWALRQSFLLYPHPVPANKVFSVTVGPRYLPPACDRQTRSAAALLTEWLELPREPKIKTKISKMTVKDWYEPVLHLEIDIWIKCWRVFAFAVSKIFHLALTCGSDHSSFSSCFDHQGVSILPKIWSKHRILNVWMLPAKRSHVNMPDRKIEHEIDLK